jgi:hypothetical protein
MSILDLLRSNGMPSKEKQPQEDKSALYNPDVPDPELEVSDTYHTIYKMPSSARNGIFSLGTKRIYKNKAREAFSKDGAIDPNTIRNKIDPDNAMPVLSSQGKFSLMNAAAKKAPHSQVGLIKKSLTSFLNYRNRFAAGGEPDVAANGQDSLGKIKQDYGRKSKPFNR